jgi:uncharacterized protein (DUF2147 family)
MKRHLAAAALMTLAAGLAQAQVTPAGLWKTIDDETKQEKSLVRISEAGGVFTGRIDKLLDPAKQDSKCDKCSDERKDQPVLGMTILRNVKAHEDEKDRWDGGDILDPNNGKLYKVRIKPVDGGRKLEVRGYIGAPLLGRTQTWIRVE